MIVGFVAGDAVEPGREFLFIAQLVAGLKGGDEGLRGQIFDIGTVLPPAVDVIGDLIDVTVVEL